uniref:protein-serine/threonine phosphatase n=1 Tax=Aegilops tauschii subsp. strangulata TaxID=200361 RepID=A0A453EYY1_AEGTS
CSILFYNEFLLLLCKLFCLPKFFSYKNISWPDVLYIYIYIYIPFTGDRYLKPWIIPVPEVTIVPRAKDDECLILASDGLWDVLSNEEVCDVARKRILLWHKKNGVNLSSAQRSGDSPDPAAQAAAECLSKLALQKGSKDNITVIVVDLKAQRKFKSKT